MNNHDRAERTIIATSGGKFGQPRDTYFECDLPSAVDHYPRSTEDIDRLIIQASRAEAPAVLCLTTGSDPRRKNIPAFDAALSERFERAGASAVDTMMLTFYAPGDREVQARIDAADIVYVSGGTSHLLNPTLRRRGVDALLSAAAESNTVLSGLSAGLCCWFSRIISGVTPSQATKVEGLGWFDALVAPHWETEPFRHKPFHQELLDNPGLVGLAFDEHTAIEIRGDRYRLHSFGPGGHVRRGHYCEETGVYSFEPVECSPEFGPLSNLGIASS